jgi:hypothetical protein
VFRIDTIVTHSTILDALEWFISSIRELDGTTKTAANENKAEAEKKQNIKDEPNMKDDQNMKDAQNMKYDNTAEKNRKEAYDTDLFILQCTIAALSVVVGCYGYETVSEYLKLQESKLELDRKKFVEMEYKALLESLRSRQINKLLSNEEIMQQMDAIIDEQVNKHICSHVASKLLSEALNVKNLHDKKLNELSDDVRKALKEVLTDDTDKK